MKKSFARLLAATLVCVLTACATTPPSAPASAAPTAPSLPAAIAAAEQIPDAPHPLRFPLEDI